jgi:hypothetical protein
MKLNRRIATGAVAIATAMTVVAVAAPASAHEKRGHGSDDARGVTTVVLNQGLVPGLVGLGVAPIRPGTLTAPGGVYQVAFPITEIEHGRVKHSGGLEFTKAAAGDVRITKFIVDTKKGVLTARTTIDGKRIGRLAIFTLGPVQEISPGVTPACSGIAAGLTLTPAAAGALLGDSTALAFVGDACVVPSAGSSDDED